MLVDEKDSLAEDKIEEALRLARHGYKKIFLIWGWAAIIFLLKFIF
jgi:hypothetical protein